MALRLHVWGPALGLGSIDPECLAAIAYFSQVVSQGDWTLIASNDASVSPDHVLPALEHYGSWAASGFNGIVTYLDKQSECRSLDNDLTRPQRAESLACASYLATRGSALLALLLYVSPTAWVDVTRPALSTLLPFPLPWTVAPALRSAAIDKVQGLGLGHLATAVEEQEHAANESGVATTTATGFLRLPQRLGPSKTMQPEETAAIRLQSLADEFFSVLEEIRGDKAYFVRDDRPSSIDFLVHAYLRLMLVPTPQPFLRKALESSSAAQHARLLEYAQRDNVIPPALGNQNLPWDGDDSSSSPGRLFGVLARFAEGTVESIPGFVGEGWAQWRRGGVRSLEDDDVKDRVYYHANESLNIGLAVLGGFTAAAAAWLFRSSPPLGAPTHTFVSQVVVPSPRRLSEFGEVGAMLRGVGGF